MPSELQREAPQPLPDSPPPSSIEFDWLERKALRLGLPADNAAYADFDQLALQTAQALISADRVHARLELTAKALAAARARLLVLETHLDQRYAAGNERGIRQSLKMVEAARRHFVALLAEHRHACEGGRRTPVKVSVGQANAVNVMAVSGTP